jgi:hypothetical protein
VKLRVRGIPLVILVALALGATAGLWAPACNRYVSPLGRLAGEVHEGDDYATVRAKFVAYHESRRPGGDAQFADGAAACAASLVQARPTDRCLFLYDVTLFDDIQLLVRFDSSGRAVEKVFIGD